MRLPDHPAVLAAVLAAALAVGAGPAGAPSAWAAPLRATPADAHRGGPMPDSVLAWIGSRREVSLAAFREAWRQVAPPLRPDSLTPEAARRFLDLLCGREALADLALADPPDWSAADSARVQGLRDQLTLRAALDSALAATRERMAAVGDPAADPQTVGLAARDSLVARLAPRWDADALERVAAAFRALPRPTADSGVAAQIRMMGRLPALAAGDSARVLAETSAGPYRAADLMGWWARLDPLGRPRIGEADQVRDLVANALFERALRDDARRRGLERRGDVAAALERLREAIAVEHRLAREVYGRIAGDEATLRRHHQRHGADFALPLRARVLRLVLEDRASATRMALSLRDEAAAESLLARAARRGVRYDAELTAAGDSALFARARAAGAGTVLGPDSTAAGWQVVRVRAVVAERPLTFEEAREQVARDWTARESERLTEELLVRSRRTARVRVNERALRGLTAP